MWGPASPSDLQKIVSIHSLGFSMVTCTYGVNIDFVYGSADVAGLTCGQGHRQSLVSQDEEYKF